MKSLPPIAFLLLLVSLPSCAIRQPSQLLPGVTYYDGPEKLTGTLTFLLQHDIRSTNSNSSASIYEFDLADKQLRKVTESPTGLFVPPEQGDLFCVVYGPFDPSGRGNTNAFIYAEATRQSRIVRLESAPETTIISGGHVFFRLEDPHGKRLIDYEFALDQKRPADFSDARWQKRSDAQSDYRAFNGSHIFFEGSGSPAQGFMLVSSPLSCFETEFQDPGGKKVKVLKRFSRLAALGGASYLLNHMSPDGHYAVVRLDEPTVPKTMEQSGWARTYYAVDVSTGKIRVLLKENVDHTTCGSMSGVWWAGSIK
jgi:hypothetical protein